MNLTISVEYLRQKANHFLAESEDGWADQRRGIASFIELVLYESGNYSGFGYLDSAEVNYDAEKFECKDDTRRVYHQSAALGREADRKK